MVGGDESYGFFFKKAFLLLSLASLETCHHPNKPGLACHLGKPELALWTVIDRWRVTTAVPSQPTPRHLSKATWDQPAWQYQMPFLVNATLRVNSAEGH